jgi:hypothetical protein
MGWRGVVSTPEADLVVEAQRVVGRAEREGVALRVTGGVGIAIHCPSTRRPPLARRYADIDVVGRARERREIVALMVGLGYTAEERFNAMHGTTRLLFFDEHNGRQLDVFLDRVEMCHTLDLRDRLLPGMVTLSLADLLAMKLQIVETNEKDLLDATALFADHALSEDEAGINVAYLASLAAADWGLWRTLTMIAERVADHAATLDERVPVALVRSQVAAFVERLETEPKTRSWRLRARIGDRKRWYELPEEARP